MSLKITEPPKSNDNKQCDLRSLTATYFEVSRPRGIVSKRVSKQQADSVQFFSWMMPRWPQMSSLHPAHLPRPLSLFTLEGALISCD